MALRATKGNEDALEPVQWIKVFDYVFNGVPMARCGPPKAMKTRSSRHNEPRCSMRLSTERCPGRVFHQALQLAAASFSLPNGGTSAPPNRLRAAATNLYCY